MAVRKAEDNLVFAGGTPRHIPVLLDEMLAMLQPVDGGIYVDGTFGAGGYSRAILTNAETSIIAIDQDPDVIKSAR